MTRNTRSATTIELVLGRWTGAVEGVVDVATSPLTRGKRVGRSVGADGGG